MTTSSIVELRRYRLRPGAREELIALFEREFVEAQEAAGIEVIGQFRDLADEDSFVWLRGFRDMADRARALRAFYTGPTWTNHGAQASATMINSDNVLLLRPADGVPWPLVPRREQAPTGLVVSTVCYLAPRTDGPFATFFTATLLPALERAGANLLAGLVVERSPNTFPRLPVRESETVFVWLAGFAGPDAYSAHQDELASSPAWSREALPEMARRTWRPNEVSRLVPTARSRLRG